MRPSWDDQSHPGPGHSQPPSVPPLCQAWYQGQAPEKGRQNCASFLDPLVPGITVSVHGNKVEPRPQNPGRREAKASSCHTPVSTTHSKTGKRLHAKEPKRPAKTGLGSLNWFLWEEGPAWVGRGVTETPGESLALSQAGRVDPILRLHRAPCLFWYPFIPLCIWLRSGPSLGSFYLLWADIHCPLCSP